MNINLNSDVDSSIIRGTVKLDQNPDPRPNNNMCVRLSLTQMIQRGMEMRNEKTKYTINNKPLIHIARESSRRGGQISRPTRSLSRKTVNSGKTKSPNISITSTRNPTTSCPLRIAELAEPTKRQCLGTWRDQRGKLPNFMLDRLKKHVMNQKIVAEIPDAINCFKVKRQNASNGLNQRCQGRYRAPPRTMKNADNFTELRMMSAIFAHRMASRLIKPLHLVLSENLQRLSEIVAIEIKKLIQNRRICADYVYDHNLLMEMSGKIACWISSIMDDAKFKLMEDELRAQKAQENKLGKDGNLVTLIDQYVRYQMEGRTDLEEEEGPALDAVDTLMNNVMDICLSKSDTDSFAFQSPNKTSHESILVIQTTIYDEPRAESSVDNMNVDKSETEKKEKNDTNEPNEDDNSQENKIITDSIPDEIGVYNLSENQNLKNSDDSGSKHASTEELGSTAGDKNVIENIVDEEKPNVSEVNVTLEEPLDERKKVKFSQVVDGIRPSGGDGAGETGESGRAEPGTGVIEPKRVKSADLLGKWPSITRIRSDIVFKQPNHSILSVADETWPQDFMVPTLRPSESATKSITSLGEIKEMEEPKVDDDNQDRTHYLSNDLDELELKQHDHENSAGTTSPSKDQDNFIDTDGEQFNIHRNSPDKHDSSEFTSKELHLYDTDAYISELTRAQERWSMTSDSFNRKSHLKLFSNLKTTTTVDETEQSKETEHQKQNHSMNGSEVSTDAGKGDHIIFNAKQVDTDDTQKNVIFEAVKGKLRNDTNTKFDYRVNKKTAPRWAMTSPSEDSVPVRKKRKPKAQNELCNWLKDIENMFFNLEQWDNWLYFVCREILYLKHETVTCKILEMQDQKRELKEWVGLKRNIDKDAVQWRKMNRHALTVLKYHSPNKSSKSENTFSKPPLPITQNRRLMESVSDVMLSIEGLSVLLHRSIVSTEHSFKCNCRNLATRPHILQIGNKPHDLKN